MLRYVVWVFVVIIIIVMTGYYYYYYYYYHCYHLYGEIKILNVSICYAQQVKLAMQSYYCLDCCQFRRVRRLT